MSPDTKTLLNLSILFILVSGLIAMLSYLLWRVLGRKRVIAAVTDRLSPTQMRSKFRAKLANFLGFFLLGLLFAGLACYLSMSFGKWDYEPDKYWRLLPKLADWFQLDPLSYPLSNDPYQVAICFGVGLAVLSGFMLGGPVGKVFGMKHATKRFRITETLL